MLKLLKTVLMILIITIFSIRAEARTEKMLVTGYCICEKCCLEFADAKTSIGDDAKICDGVAAAPKAIPYRTKLRIPGVGIKEVDDTGRVLRELWEEEGKYHIDIRFSTHQKALEWGRQILGVEILE